MANRENRDEERMDTSSLEDQIESVNEAAESLASRGIAKIKSMAQRAFDVLKRGVSAGSAAIDIGKSAVDSAVSMDQAMNNFIATTGKGEEEAGRYQGVLEEIYKNNYGDSFDDIAGAMEQVTLKMGDMDDTSLQEVTESAFALRDTFQYDIADSADAAKAMMKSFGTSGEDAMSLIAAGAQNGMRDSDEFLSSISEYSPQFAQLGLGADDMFKIFEAGAESGSFSMEQIGEAMGEMSGRVLEGSDSAREGFELLGLNADEMSEKFAAGGDSAKEAFEQTIDAMAGLEDPMAQNAAGVDLFGAAWEEMGPEVAEQLAGISEGAYDTTDAMNGIKEAGSGDLGSMFEEMQRSVEMLILPLGEQLIPILGEIIESIMPVIEEVLPPLIEIIGEMIAQLQPIIEEILPMLIDLFASIVPPLMELINAVLPVIIELFGQFLPPLIELIDAVLPVLIDLFEVLMAPLGIIIDTILPILIDLFHTLITPISEIINAVLPFLIELIDALLPIFQALVDILTPIIDLFVGLLGPILDLITDALNPLIDAISPVIDILVASLMPVLEDLGKMFSDIFGGILETVTTVIDTVKGVFNGIVDFVKNVFSGDWEGAWNSIVEIFSTIVDGIGNIIKSPINFIIDAINDFIAGINSIEIPDWVPLIGGKGFHIPKIPRLRVGLDYVPKDDYAAFLHKGEAVLTAQENALYRSVGGFDGLAKALSQPVDKTDTYVTLQDDRIIPEFDYRRMGETTAEALERAGLSVKIDRRELGRVVREVQG